MEGRFPCKYSFGDIIKFKYRGHGVVEGMYGLHRGFIAENVLNKDELNQIATDAFKSGLGVRSVTSSIQRKVDDYIFEHFENMNYLD